MEKELMSLNAKKVKGPKQSVEQALLEAGTYAARLVQIVDLGLQPQDAFKGQEKPPAHMIYTTYELLDEFMVDKEGNPDETKPRWISEKLPFYSLDQDRAKSTQRYKALDPNVDHDGEWTELIGLPVMITIGVYKSKSTGKEGNAILSTATMRAKEAAKAPELVNKPKVFLLDDPDLDVLLSLPDWLQKLVKDNLEFKGSALEKALAKGYKKKEEEDESEYDGEESEAQEGEGSPW